MLDSRYAKLRPALPQGQVVCFLAESEISPLEASEEWYNAQYSLAPTLLTPGSNCEFVISYSPQSDALLDKKFALVRDSGDGVKLFRRERQ